MQEEVGQVGVGGILFQKAGDDVLQAGDLAHLTAPLVVAAAVGEVLGGGVVVAAGVQVVFCCLRPVSLGVSSW